MDPQLPAPPEPLSPTEVAHKVYGDAFEQTSRRALAEAQRDFGILTPVEQRFTHCHLLYLSVTSQARTQQLLEHVLALLDGQVRAIYAIAEALTRPLPGDPHPRRVSIPSAPRIPTQAGPLPPPPRKGVSFDELEARVGGSPLPESLAEVVATETSGQDAGGEEAGHVA